MRAWGALRLAVGRSRRRGACFGVACLVASALAVGGVDASSAATGQKLDARWAALQNCLIRGQQLLPANQGGPGRVRTISPGVLHVFFDAQPRYAGFTAAFIYKGTFARAEAAAKRIKKQRNALHGVGTAAGLAIGNVTYYFTGWGSTPELTVLTACLPTVYAGQPRWPANVNPTSLSTEPGGKPWTVG